MLRTEVALSYIQHKNCWPLTCHGKQHNPAPPAPPPPNPSPGTYTVLLLVLLLVCVGGGGEGVLVCCYHQHAWPYRQKLGFTMHSSWVSQSFWPTYQP